MNYLKQTILPVFLTGIWINISETVKWELILKFYWIEHYQGLNLDFPLEPANNIVWMIWGFLLATIVFILSKKFSLVQTTFLAWSIIFVMLWIVLGNIDMLPSGLLWYNAPLSLLEIFVASLICKKLT